MQRHHHYERAFEAYLRRRRIPYVAVNEARKALLPDDAPLLVTVGPPDAPSATQRSLKSFDLVIYATASAGPNLLADVKGRKMGLCRDGRMGRLESWVTEDDVRSLGMWERLFGPGFAAAFVFVYWSNDQPADGLFDEIFQHGNRWYAVRVAFLSDYVRHMTQRSPRWRTVHVPREPFERIGKPLAAVGAW